jgi:hypothetical protein
MYPCGILTNTATGRFHPIVFRPAPMPSGADLDAGMQRHKSLGHHTEGFDVIEDAVAFIASKPGQYDTGMRGEWDGADVPAMVMWFSAEAPAHA